MEMADLVNMQVQLDEANGFPVAFGDQRQRYSQLTRDLVGLVGEVGEFANIVKKVNIKLDRPTEYELDLVKAEEALHEELADCVIYLLRISALLKVNVEQLVVKKIEANATRYAGLRRK
jgi:NTP pyrophosphatase (non-canonical NTP hydrolase)